MFVNGRMMDKAILMRMIFAGPNYDYSLTEARKNFKNNGIMFRESDRENLRKYLDE
jgi:hypothetical protein